MQYIELREQLKDFRVFSLSDIRKIEADFDLRRLNEWQEKNYIKKVRQGYYIFSDLEMSERVLFGVANSIYQPSYISLEMALSFYNLIPEGVYEITSVTSQKTNKFNTGIGRFTYKHIKPELMFGYELQEYDGHKYVMAEIEKAVLDYLYLKPTMKDEKDFKGLRFNADEFKKKADTNRLQRYAEAFHSKALLRRVSEFISYIEHAES